MSWSRRSRSDLTLTPINTQHRRFSSEFLVLPDHPIEWNKKPLHLHYECIKILGKGSQGTVMSLRNIRLPSRDVVGKFFIDTPENRELVTNEISILKHLNYDGCRPFLLCFQENFSTSSRSLSKTCSKMFGASDILVVVYDYFLGPDTIPLSKIIDIDSEYSEDDGDQYSEEEGDKDEEQDSSLDTPFSLLTILKTLLKTVDYLHTNGVAHLDLKPDNIIINIETKRVQLIDFGMSCMTESCKSGGTTRYMSPEAALGMSEKRHGKILREDAFKADCWSIGVLLYELFNGKSPFKDIELNTPLTLLFVKPHHLLKSSCQLYTKEINYVIDEIIDGLLSIDKDKRLDITTCLFLLGTVIKVETPKTPRTPRTPRTPKSPSGSF